MAAITVEVTGEFLVESSLARVNRGLFGALARREDVDLGILAEPTAARLAATRAGELSDDALLEARRRKRFYPAPEVTIRHRWPPVFPRIASGAYVHMQPWEFGSVPKQWVEELREVADDVWCYGSFVAGMYLRAGIDAERVHVVPLGVDPTVFAPGPPAASSKLGERCVFLYVGDTIARKGVDVAVKAYRAAFSANDAVALVVKDFGAKAAGDTALRDEVIALAERRDGAPIVYLDATYTDAALAQLYRTARALVAPYRGEGFGLPVLEAMACGTPAIVTRGGATDDFAHGENAFLVDARQVSLGPAYAGYELAGEAFWLEPSVESVAAAMREVYLQPERAKEMGRRAAEDVASGWTWAKGAERAAERLHALAGRTPRAAGRAPSPRELNRFELRIASRGGEDGILLEIFRRIGVEDPFFAELVGAGEEPAATVFLASSLGWRGIVIPWDASRSGGLAQQLAANGARQDFELLVLGPGGRAAWAGLGPYRPQVVVASLAADPGHAETARASGYLPVGAESTGTNAFFVRGDVLPKTRFPEIAS